MTAELAPLTPESAERLSLRISLKLDAMADAWTGAMPLIRQAIEQEAFRVLGYRSHGDYIADRFGGALSKLGVEMRREVTRELSDAGLSTRAIAPVVGVSQQMVSKDLRSGDNQVVTSDPEVSPEPEETETYTVTHSIVDADTGEVLEAPTVTEHTVTEKTKVTTGIDGKEYKRPEPKPKPKVLEGDALADYDARQNTKSISDALQTLDLMTTAAHRQRVITKWWPRATQNEEVPPWGRDLFKPDPIRQIAQALNSLANELENQS